MKKIGLAVVLFAAFLFAGCVYDYGVSGELEGLETDLVVIEGDIIAGGITEVYVSTTSRIHYQPTKGIDVLPREPLCQVWVESAQGEVWPGKDTTYLGRIDVLYGTNLYQRRYVVDTRDLPLDGEYRLCVSYPDRGEYHSAFRKVITAQEIKSFDFSFAPDSSHVNVLLSSRGSREQTTYYRWVYQENWENEPPLMPNVLYMDYYMLRLSEEQKDRYAECFGKYASSEILIENTGNLSENVVKDKVVTTLYRNHRKLAWLYSIEIYQTPLDKEGYDYYRAMKINTEELGGLYDPYPSELRGNIVSATYPDEAVLGFVNVCTRAEKRIYLDGKANKLFDHRRCRSLETLRHPGDMKYRMWYDAYNNLNKRPYDCDVERQLVEIPGAEPGMPPTYEYVDVRNCEDVTYWGISECLDVQGNCYPKPDFWPR